MGWDSDTPGAPGAIGGDPHLNAVLFEAIDRVASPDARVAMILRALAAAEEPSLPERLDDLVTFVEGPLRDVAEATLGAAVAVELMNDVTPLFRRIQASRKPPASDPAATSDPAMVAVEPVRALTGRPNKIATLPPTGLFRETPPDRARPPVAKRGTLPYTAATTSDTFVLLIDDDVAFLRGLSKLLRSEGVEVLTAPDGGRGLRICDRLRPALVITDLDMAPPNGLEVAKGVAERFKDDAPPVVLLTGATQLPTSAVGVDRILTKNADHTALLAAIEELVPR